MTRTTAIIITAITALCCGCPGLSAMCLGVLAISGTQMPEVMAQSGYTPEQTILSASLYLCGGLIALIVPFVAGFVSFRMVKPEPVAAMPDNLPPTA